MTPGAAKSLTRSAWIEQMRAKHENLAVDKLILVSESGFTAQALRKALFYDIETLTIEEAMATDWPLLSRLESSGVFELTTIHYKCTVVYQFEDGTLEQFDAPLDMPINAGGAKVTLEHMIRTLVDQPQFRDALYPHIKGAGEHDFWVSYTQPCDLGEFQHDGRNATITELRIGLKVIRRESPVGLTKGTYKSTPFVAGTAAPGVAPLQFVLAKKPDGQVTAFLVDAEGIRALTSSSADGT
jgi:hypothetical protein